MIDVRLSHQSMLRQLAEKHPLMNPIGYTEAGYIEWRGADSDRSIHFAQPQIEVGGLVELMDNNPLVCANVASVPDAASTIALVALGPAVRACIFADTPVLALSEIADEALVSAFLAKEGWIGGISIHSEPLNADSLIAAKAMVEIDPSIRFEDVLDLYEEAYGRSFFVKRNQDANWNRSLVEGGPSAFYRLELQSDDRASLLKVQVIADRNGKCGAAQGIHMFNLMNGFEESLGLEY